MKTWESQITEKEAVIYTNSSRQNGSAGEMLTEIWRN